jgi:hypothetical protein
MVDVVPNNNQISSDDQELAKVLAGVGPDEPVPEPAQEAKDPEPTPELTTEEAPEPEVPTEEETPAGTNEALVPRLNNVRSRALQDIKPLLDKLDVPADEKFDIYIEVLRASNDQSLIEPAYNITPDISDDTRRADDLLTIIREIDSLNPPEA